LKQQGMTTWLRESPIPTFNNFQLGLATYYM